MANRRLSATQIIKTLTAAGMKQLGEDEHFTDSTPKNTFRIEGRATLMVKDEKAMRKACKALLATNGRTFGGFRCGWGGYNLTENYTISEHARLVAANID